VNLYVRPITFYAHGIHLTKEDISLVNKLIETIKKNYTGTIELEIIDIGTMEIEQQEYKPKSHALIFGKFIEEQVISHIENYNVTTWGFPDIKKLHKKPENEASRSLATERIKYIIESLVYSVVDKVTDVLAEDTKEETEVVVKKNETTFGKIADICITEKEAEYLKRVKDLLGGSKIVIKKGDITIEVE